MADVEGIGPFPHPIARARNQDDSSGHVRSGSPGSARAPPFDGFADRRPPGLRCRRLRAGIGFWPEQAPQGHLDTALLAEGRAALGREGALESIGALRKYQPVEADATLARWHFNRGATVEAANALVRSFEGFRSDPWPRQVVMRRALRLAAEINQKDPEQGRAPVRVREPTIRQ